MTKQNFIALADAVKAFNKGNLFMFTPEQVRMLADFCQTQNRAFNRDRWLRYVAGECGPNGGRAVRRGRN